MVTQFSKRAFLGMLGALSGHCMCRKRHCYTNTNVDLWSSSLVILTLQDHSPTFEHTTRLRRLSRSRCLKYLRCTGHSIFFRDVIISYLQEVCQIARSKNTILFFEPVSAAKSLRGLSSLDSLDFISPNVQELEAMAQETVRRKQTASVLQESVQYKALPSLSGSHIDSLSAYGQIRFLTPHIGVLIKVRRHLLLFGLSKFYSRVDIFLPFLPLLDSKRV